MTLDALRDRRHVVGHALATLAFRPFLTFETALDEAARANDPLGVARWVEERTAGATIVAEDAHLAHPATLAVLGQLVGRQPIVVTIAVGQARSAAVRETLAGWGQLEPVHLTVSRLDDRQARELVRITDPTLDETHVERIVAASNGNPAWLIAGANGEGNDPRATAVLGDLDMAGRTALVAAGLLARPADPSLLGPGVEELLDNGLAWNRADGTVDVVGAVARSALRRVATSDRAAVHSRLADRLTEPAERSRHLAACGRTEEAVAEAVLAAEQADSPLETAAHRQFAATLRPETEMVLAAAEELIQVGDLHAASGWLDHLRADGPEGMLTAARIHRYRGEDQAASEAVRRGLLLAEPDSTVWRRLTVEALWSAPPESADLVAGIALDACRGTDEESHAIAVVAAASLELQGFEHGALARLDLTTLGAPEMFHAGLSVSRALLRSGHAESAAEVADLVARLAETDAPNWAGLARVEAAWCSYLLAGPDHVIAETAELLASLLGDEARDRARALLHLSLVDHDPTVVVDPDQLSQHGHTSDRLWAAVAAEAQLAAGDLVEASTAAARAGIPTRDPVTALLAGPAAVASSHQWGTAEADLSQFPALAAEASALGTGEAAELERVADLWRDVALRGVARCLLAAGTPTARAAAAEVASSAGLTRWAARAGVRRADGNSDSPLTNREREVLELVGVGCTTPAIARRLGIAVSTVETHVKNAKMKLGVSTRAAAATMLP